MQYYIILHHTILCYTTLYSSTNPLQYTLQLEELGCLEFQVHFFHFRKNFAKETLLKL